MNAILPIQPLTITLSNQINIRKYANAPKMPVRNTNQHAPTYTLSVATTATRKRG